MRSRDKNAPLRVVRNVEDDVSPNLELIQPLEIDKATINQPVNEIAQHVTVDVRQIYVDHDYQRDRSHESFERIMRMARNWDWALFERPLLYVDHKDRISVIDGQHTTIAWLTIAHVLGYDMPANMLNTVHSARIAAEIFVGRNMNRTRLHQLQEYKAAVFAEKPWALQIQKLAEATSVRIPTQPELAKQPNTLMAIGTVDVLLDRHGYQIMKRVFDILTEGNLRPIGVTQIKAMTLLLTEPQFKGQFTVEKLKAMIRSTSDPMLHGRAIQEAIEHKLPRHESMANVYRKEYQKRFA